MEQADGNGFHFMALQQFDSLNDVGLLHRSQNIAGVIDTFIDLEAQVPWHQRYRLFE